jgi:hypothetical protein
MQRKQSKVITNLLFLISEAESSRILLEAVKQSFVPKNLVPLCEGRAKVYFLLCLPPVLQLPLLNVILRVLRIGIEREREGYVSCTSTLRKILNGPETVKYHLINVSRFRRDFNFLGQPRQVHWHSWERVILF